MANQPASPDHAPSGIRLLFYPVPMEPGEVTELLRRWSAGDESALSRLAPLVYSELRGLARRSLRNERKGHSLSSTALVHEAYLRIVDQRKASFQNRAHFFAVSGRIMRRVLVDHARARLAAKRGSGAALQFLDENVDEPANARHRSDARLVSLDDALRDLARLDSRQGRIVELRFFLGLSIEEAADALGVSPATVNRDWLAARAFLVREMSRQAHPAG